MKTLKHIKLYLFIVNLFAIIFLNNNVELFSQAGILQSTYGISGVNYKPIDVNSDEYIWSAFCQSDGKILLAGSSNSKSLIVRYNSDGSYDNTFNGNGKLISNTGSFYKVIVDLSGKIYVTGSDNVSNLILVRLNSDGSYDNTFDNDGIVNTGVSSIVFDFKILTDGKFLLCGWNSHSIIKLNSDGSFDNSFGTNGIFTLPDLGNLRLESFGLQSTGNLIVVGWDQTNDKVDIYRINSNGTFDNSFGTNGLLQLGSLGNVENGKSVVIQSDDKIVIGAKRLDAFADFILYKLNSDGSLDNSFGTNGKIVKSFINFDILQSVLLDENNNIYAIGAESFASDMIIIKYTSNGIPDVSFGTNGIFLNKVSFHLPTYPYASCFTKNKDIIIAGNTHNGAFFDTFSAKITTGIIQLTTNSVSKTSQTSLRLQGNISYDGNTSVTSRGFVYSKTQTPTIATNDGIVDAGTGTGNIIASISDLTPNTNYSFRAYATNVTGTYYGDIIAITTNKSDNTTDYDSDGVYDYLENLAPNNGDGNNDGILDSQQDYVASFPNVKDSTYITIVELNSNALINTKSIQSTENSYYQYPFGLVSFSIAALTSNIKIYYYGSSNLTGNYFRKKNSINKYYNFNVNYSSEIINSKSIATSTFYLTDGGIGDDDNFHNGLIYDPGGPATLVADVNIPIFDSYSRMVLIFTLSLFGIYKVKKSVLK